MYCRDTSWGEILHSYSGKVKTLKETAVPLLDMTALSQLIEPLPASVKISSLVTACLVRFPQLVAELGGEFVDVSCTSENDDPEAFLEVQAGTSDPCYAMQARCKRTGRILLSIATLCLTQGIYPAIFFSQFLKHLRDLGRPVRYGSGVFLDTPERLPCANLSPHYSECCRKPAKISCPGCQLVAYCSPECRSAHGQQVHNDECVKALQTAATREMARKRALHNGLEHMKTMAHPDPITVWDRVPAFGVMGGITDVQDMASPFRILLANTVDLNNMIETLHQLDEGYAGELQILIQAPACQVLARSLILCSLLLQMASGEIDSTALDAVIAIWYSAELTPGQYLLLMDTIAQLLNTIPNILPCCSVPPPPSPFQPHRHILEIQKDMKKLSADHDGERQFGIVKQITCSGSSLSTRIHGVELYKYLALMGLSSVEPDAASREALLALCEEEKVDLNDACLLEPHYYALEKFAKSGLLLPFAAHSNHHCLPNPTLVSAIDSPRAGWTATCTRRDPLCGWSIHQVTSEKLFHVPRNDLYGNLYFHIRDRIQSAVAKIGKCKIAFEFSDDRTGIELRKALLEEWPGLRSLHIARHDLVNWKGAPEVSQQMLTSLLSIFYHLLVDGGSLILLSRSKDVSKSDMKAARLLAEKFISNPAAKSNGEFARRLLQVADADENCKRHWDRISVLFLPHDAYIETMLKLFAQAQGPHSRTHFCLWDCKPSVPASQQFLTFKPFMFYRKRPLQPIKVQSSKKKGKKNRKPAEQNGIGQTVLQETSPSISIAEECYKEVMLTLLDHDEVLLEVRKIPVERLLQTISGGDIAKEFVAMNRSIEDAEKALVHQHETSLDSRDTWRAAP